MNKIFILLVLFFYGDVCYAMTLSTEDQQLSKIIKNIEVKSEEGCSRGIAYDGRHIYWDYHPGEWVGTATGQIGGMERWVGNLDIRPIERAVLNLRQEPRENNSYYSYSYDESRYSKKKYKFVFPYIAWNGDVKMPRHLCASITRRTNHPKSDCKVIIEDNKMKLGDIKMLLDYLIFDPAAMQLTYDGKRINHAVRQELISKYIPIENKIEYTSYMQSTDFFKKNFYDLKKCNYSMEELKILIEQGLNLHADMTVILRLFVLNNDMLFSQDKNCSSGEYELAEWLLHEKNGRDYLSILLAQSAEDIFKKKKYCGKDCFQDSGNCTLVDNDFNGDFSLWDCDEAVSVFTRCFALAEKYNVVADAQQYMGNSIKLAVKNGYIDLLQFFIDKKLCTQDSLNEALFSAQTSYHVPLKKVLNVIKALKGAGANNFTEALRKVEKSFDLVPCLLEYGADPNVLFYRDEKGIKKLKLPTYRYSVITKSLQALLLSPKRIIDNDEPSDTEYLKAEVHTINSIFDKKKKVQKDLYNYAIHVYGLAFEAQKTGKYDQLKWYILQKHQSERVDLWRIWWQIITTSYAALKNEPAALPVKRKNLATFKIGQKEFNFNQLAQFQRVRY
ncbi:MAG: hypothetical protein WC707_00460 [Candidatus Babeliaceae bacterium]|jgi:hypothetical protein